jgi:hypothetical protein
MYRWTEGEDKERNSTLIQWVRVVVVAMLSPQFPNIEGRFSCAITQILQRI